MIFTVSYCKVCIKKFHKFNEIGILRIGSDKRYHTGT